MNKLELEALLEELDKALVKGFPGPEPMSVLVVGGGMLTLSGSHHSAHRRCGRDHL